MLNKHMITCARCRRPLNPQNAYWCQEGRICIECNSGSEEIYNPTKTLTGTSWGSIGLAVLSCFFNPVFFVSAISLFLAVQCIRYIRYAKSIPSLAAKAGGYGFLGSVSISAVLISSTTTVLGAIQTMSLFAS